jgi:hypothetical protein
MEYLQMPLHTTATAAATAAASNTHIDAGTNSKKVCREEIVSSWDHSYGCQQRSQHQAQPPQNFGKKSQLKKVPSIKSRN